MPFRISASAATSAIWVAGSRLTIDDDDVLFRGIDGETREKLADDDLTNSRYADTMRALMRGDPDGVMMGDAVLDESAR